jgi:transposase-like protein
MHLGYWALGKGYSAMERAVKAYLNKDRSSGRGMSVQAIASAFNVPKSTLLFVVRDYKALALQSSSEIMSHYAAKIEARQILTVEQKKQLSEHLLMADDCGCAFVSSEIGLLIANMLKIEAPTERWVNAFIEEDPILTKRKADQLDRNRLTGTSKKKINHYFNTVLPAAFKIVNEKSVNPLT